MILLEVSERTDRYSPAGENLSYIRVLILKSEMWKILDWSEFVLLRDLSMF